MSTYVCLNFRNTCTEAGKHTQGCIDWNYEKPGGEWTNED